MMLCLAPFLLISLAQCNSSPYKYVPLPTPIIQQSQLGQSSSIPVNWINDQTTTTPPIVAYQLEYAELSSDPDFSNTANLNDEDDKIDFAIYSTDIGEASAGNTVQILTIKADQGQSFSASDVYQLAFPFGGNDPHIDREANTVTRKVKRKPFFGTYSNLNKN